MRNMTDLLNALSSGVTLASRTNAHDQIAFIDRQFVASEGELLMLVPDNYRALARMGILNGVTHWEGERYPLDQHDPYWLSTSLQVLPGYWCNSAIELEHLRNGVVHRTHGKAALHFNALQQGE